MNCVDNHKVVHIIMLLTFVSFCSCTHHHSIFICVFVFFRTLRCYFHLHPAGQEQAGLFAVLFLMCCSAAQGKLALQALICCSAASMHLHFPFEGFARDDGNKEYRIGNKNVKKTKYCGYLFRLALRGLRED